MTKHQTGNKELYLRIRALAREMRKNSTEAEDFFWEKVKDRQLLGLKFNRQFIIQFRVDNIFTKYYIADFHCHILKLIVELDGHIHIKQQEEDLLRTENMIEMGFTVLRFTNDQILNHWQDVEMRIKEYLDSYLNSPSLANTNVINGTILEK